MHLKRVLAGVALALGLLSHAPRAEAQAMGATDQFNVTIPFVMTMFVGTNWVGHAVIQLRNPNDCGTVKYNTYVTTYTLNANGACPTIADDIFNTPVVTICPPLFPSVLAPRDVHRINIPLPPAAQTDPVTITIEYTGVAGANAHLEADLYIFDNNPQALGGANLVAAFPLQRRGIR